jgi:murein DD-endopeptidase MepM/ murein hydrolase activator NlpD
MKYGLFLAGLVCLWMAGCPAAGPPAWFRDVPAAQAIGLVHTVREGETLTSICKAYKANLQEVAEVNGIDRPDDLALGQHLFIPDAHAPHGAKSTSRTGSAQAIKKYKGKFIWPVDGVLSSKFGIRGGRRHDGIDIGAPTGTPIWASAPGRVLYVGEQRGYGKLVILKHEQEMITVYAHNHRNLVKEGQKVSQGDRIALVGQTGRSTGPHLHFEIRKATKPRNPMFFLPRPD